MTYTHAPKQCSVVGCKSRETETKYMYQRPMRFEFRFCPKHIGLKVVGISSPVIPWARA